MGDGHGGALAIAGAWLLIYRLFTTTRCRTFAEPFTTIACGMSLAMLSPLISWPPHGYRAASLGCVGILLSCCHPAMTAFVVALCLAAGVGGFTWELCLCQAQPEITLVGVTMSTHTLLLTILVLVSVALFVLIPGIAGPMTLVLILVPLMGSLLFVVGSSEVWPSVRGISVHKLLSRSHCAADTGEPLGHSGAMRALVAWLLLAACGIAMQLYIARRARKQAETKGASAPGGSLVASLLPQKDGDERTGANLPRPSDESRYQLIAKAIYMPDDADLSHLSENEQRIVKICREDEFERDRLLWGGGLI